MISTTAVDRLIQLGRRRGGLVIDDIGQALPVDTMSTEELADVLARLEEAGISVEIDPALLTPHHRKVVLHEVKPAAEVSRRTTTDARLSSLASSIKNASLGAPRTRRPVSRQPSTTIFVFVAVLILFLLVLAVWYFA